MNILFVTSECAPFSKSGGLADVAFSLPPQLKKLGHEIAVITPLYPCVQERLNMANGTISFDRLFLTGQLKVEGNLSKGAEIRQLLGKTGI